MRGMGLWETELSRSPTPPFDSIEVRDDLATGNRRVGPPRSRLGFQYPARVRCDTRYGLSIYLGRRIG